MKINGPNPGTNTFKYLPELARSILEKHLNDFAHQLRKQLLEIGTPLLHKLNYLSEEQIVKHTVASANEFLSYIASNEVNKYLEVSSSRWYRDEITVLKREDIGAEDITVVNFVRSKILKKYAKQYSTTSDKLFQLLEEIDTLLFICTTSSTKTYIDLLHTKVEEELHFNKHLIKTSPGIIFIFNTEHLKITYVNGNIKGITGYSAEEIMLMHENDLNSLIHSGDTDVIKKHLQDITNDTTGRVHELEYRIKSKNGKYTWLRTYTVIFKKDNSRRPIELLCLSFEVTREREIAIALKKREEQLLEAQSIAQLGSFEWDMVNDTSINTPELGEILELAQSEKHNDFMKRVHPEDKEKVARTLAEAFATGKLDCQYRYLANGKEKTLWTRGRILFENGEPTLMRGTIQDITELKRIEHELLTKTRELERSNESLQQFASIASHDLKEPLRKVSMYSNMVLMSEEHALSQTSVMNLEKVKASALRMQNMIEDILNFSSITKETTKEKIDLSVIIEEVKDILGESIKEKKATIIYRNLPELCVVPSDFRQLFQNLIANSLKFSKSDTAAYIEITSQYIQNTTTEKDNSTVKRYIEIRVIDNGIGFKQEYAEKIFGLFTRLHGRSTYEGSGLGLSICKKIVENYRGSIRAESILGKGSTFIITLPEKQ